MTERLEDRALLSGATLHWQGDFDASWSNAENWLEAAAPANGDVLVFDTATAGFNGAPGGTGFRSINDLALSDVRLSLENTSASDGFDLSGNSLTVKNYNPFIQYTGGGAGGAHIRLAGLTLTGSAGISTYNSGSSLVIESPINNAGFNLNATVQSFSQPLYLSGGISGIGGFSTGSGGVVVLDGANSFTGAVSHLAGTIRLADGQALADLVTVNLASSSATLEVIAAETVGAVSGSGKIVLGASLTTGGNNASTTLSGLISGAGGLVKQGTGSFILSGVNTYAGTTTVSQGVLNIRNNSALGSTAVGTTVLAGAALELQGSITVLGETLVINGTGIAGAGALRGLVSPINTWDGPVILGSASTISSSTLSQLRVDGNINNSGYLLTVNNPVDATVVLQIGQISGSGGLTKEGAGGLILSGANTYGGLTTITSGTVSVNTATALGATTAGTNVALGGVVIVNTAGPISEPLTLQRGATLRNFQANGSWAGGIILASDAIPGASILDIVGSGAMLTITGVISGTSNLTKLGTGTLVFSAANTYTGGTNINTGTLRLGSFDLDRIPDTSAVTVANGAILNLGVYTEVIGSLAGTGNVTLGTSTFEFGRDNTSTTFNGVISGTGQVSKVGTGTFTLAGTITGTGQILMNAGTFRLGGSERLVDSVMVSMAPGADFNPNDFDETIATLNGNGTVSLGSGTLTLAGNQSSSFFGVISGNGGLTKQGTGTFTFPATFTGPNTYTGPTLVSAGTLLVNGSLVRVRKMRFQANCMAWQRPTVSEESSVGRCGLSAGRC